MIGWKVNTHTVEMRDTIRPEMRKKIQKVASKMPTLANSTQLDHRPTHDSGQMIAAMWIRSRTKITFSNRNCDLNRVPSRRTPNHRHRIAIRIALPQTLSHLSACCRHCSDHCTILPNRSRLTSYFSITSFRSGSPRFAVRRSSTTNQSRQKFAYWSSPNSRIVFF